VLRDFDSAEPTTIVSDVWKIRERFARSASLSFLVLEATRQIHYFWVV